MKKKERQDLRKEEEVELSRHIFPSSSQGKKGERKGPSRFPRGGKKKGGHLSEKKCTGINIRREKTLSLY